MYVEFVCVLVFDKFNCIFIRWNAIGELLPLFLHFRNYSQNLILNHSLEQVIRLTSRAACGAANARQELLVGNHKVLGERLESVNMSNYHMHVHKHVENFFGSMHGTLLPSAMLHIIWS